MQGSCPSAYFSTTFGQAFRPTALPQLSPPAATAAPSFPVGSVLSVPSHPSRIIKPPAPPLSPLSLPPAQVKFTPEPIEQKTLLMEKPKPPFKPSNGELQKDVDDTAKPIVVPDYEKREQTKDHKGIHKKADCDQGDSMKIITIAGDIRGAIMELRPAGKKHEPQGNSNTLIKTNPKTWWCRKLGSTPVAATKRSQKRWTQFKTKWGTPHHP